jgi:transposase InsO family protein
METGRSGIRGRAHAKQAQECRHGDGVGRRARRRGCRAAATSVVVAGRQAPASRPWSHSARGCAPNLGAFAAGIAIGLKLRHDHGSQFVADDDQGERAFLGIASSPAFVRAPEGNGCVERFILT